MKKTILILGIIFTLISVSVASSVNNNSLKLFNLNNPPYIPSDPNPSDGSIDNSICPPNLSWNGGDPDGDNVTYTVYFGKCPAQLIATNVTNTWYQLSNLLEFYTSYCWTIVAIDEYGLITSGPIWILTTEENFPPYPPSNPNPPDGATNVSPSCLSWICIDPNLCDIVTYDVYFGEEIEDPPLVKENNNSTIYCPTGNWKFNTTYTWRIVAWDSCGLNASGPIWTFRTIENLPPNEPSSPSPPDGAKCVPIDINLSWIGGDPNPFDYVTFDVYFGVTNPPTLKANNLNKPIYDPPGYLLPLKVYYWKVVAWDSGGLFTEGPIWKFTTKSPCVPSKPIIDGPTHGTIGVEYNYTFNSTYECDYLIYTINWGDDSPVEYIGPYLQGIEVNASHIWNKKGTYIIKARAEDEFGYFGPWSEFTVTMPRDKSISSSPFLRFLERYPLLNLLFQRLTA